MYTSSQLLVGTKPVTASKISWKSPSNIALIKYWGKFGRQYPKNTSISFTLDSCHTITHLEYSKKESASNSISLQFLFEGKEKPAFGTKIEKFFESILDIYPFLVEFDFKIESLNSFPHSSGIASSASSMSAIAACLCSMEQELFGSLSDSKEFKQKASYIARLGSGSACRSIYPEAALWGVHAAHPSCSNDFAVEMPVELHDNFKNFRDTILIVDKEEKKVSSRAGHALMDGNPYAEIRYAHAQDGLSKMLEILNTGDYKAFIELVEYEALCLHALMMTSHPSYVLIRPNTLAIIEKIRTYREETKQALCFTLDAGPNVHMLYPDSIAADVEKFIDAELADLCEDGKYIKDQMGQGACQL